MLVAQAEQAAQQASDLSGAELAALSSIIALVILVAFAFIAYAIKGSKLGDIANAGTFTVIGQIVFSLVVVYVVTLLMLKDVIDSEAGLPILAGVAGVIVGKARGGNASAGDGTGGGETGGGNQSARQHSVTSLD